MFKENDIIIYETNTQGPRLLYITSRDKEGYSVVEVTLTTCTGRNRVNLDSLKSLGLIKYLENREVPDMEIMNLSDVYAEYFI